MRVGMLTGGGDCPGLNAVIRAVVRKGERTYGDELRRLPRRLAGRRSTARRVPLDVERHAGHAAPGRHDPRLVAHQPVQGRRRRRAGAQATLEPTGHRRAHRHRRRGHARRAPTSCTATGVPVVGVPKTIDNDLAATELTFGFDTAVQIATDAIDRLHTTAESHDRVMVVEVMGRHAGHIATWAGHRRAARP